jgi:hypothetical protein
VLCPVPLVITGATLLGRPPQPAASAPLPPCASRQPRAGVRRSHPERAAVKVKVPDLQLGQKTLTEMSPLPLALDHVALGRNRGGRPSTGASNPALSEWATIRPERTAASHDGVSALPPWRSSAAM